MSIAVSLDLDHLGIAAVQSKLRQAKRHQLRTKAAVRKTWLKHHGDSEDRRWRCACDMLSAAFGFASKLNRRGYAGFGPCFHLPGPFWYMFLSHSQFANYRMALKIARLHQKKNTDNCSPGCPFPSPHTAHRQRSPYTPPVRRNTGFGLIMDVCPRAYLCALPSFWVQEGLQVHSQRTYPCKRSN